MDKITCPCCQAASYHPGDVRNGYCARCHWWTSDPEMAGYHFALPCDHRGQGVQLPRLEPYHRQARMIGWPDPPAAGVFPMPRLGAYIRPIQTFTRPGEPWLHTQPGTLLELAGTMRPNRRPWWRRLLWHRHIRRIIKQVRRI